MARRTNKEDATKAALDATEAARTLAARSHEARSEKVEPTPDPESEKTRVVDSGHIERLMGQRPHIAAMDAISKSRGEVEEPEAEPKAEEPKEEPKVDAPPEEPKAETPPEAVEAPAMVKVKVDGEEFEVSQTEIDEAGGVRAYQRERASENRLKKTNAVLEETRRSQAQIAEWLMRQQQQSQTPAKPQQSDEQFIAEKMDIVRFGTKEEAAKAWMEIQQRGQPKALDPQSIIQQATNKMKHDSAVADFDKEYQDVATNPLLLKLVVALRNERLKEVKGPVDWGNFYRTIGNEVRSVAGRQSQPASALTKTPSTTSSASDKEARKASITVLPTSSARAEMPKEEKELTPEEERKAWFAEQKKKRGQG